MACFFQALFEFTERTIHYLHHSKLILPPAIEIGWRLSSQHWNQGFATEGAKAVLEHTFTDLNLDEVVSFTVVNNQSSRRVMEKLGMKHNPNDDFDHPELGEDSPLKRHVLYRLSKKDWLQE